jgi:hypothetical protein
MNSGERKHLSLTLAAACVALTTLVLPAVAKSHHHGSRSNHLIAAAPTTKAVPTAATESKAAAPKSGTATAGGPVIAGIELESLPAEDQPVDTALLSVLKDVSKATRESDDVQKLEDPAQKAAIKTALDVLDAAVKRAKLNPNRILAAADKNRFEKSLTTESWDSGLLALPNNAKSSISILWAKKVNGLLNVSIAGTCGCKGDGAGGARIGEYAVVINGKSVLDSGFDIQSQSDVNFWLGKMTAVNSDATICGEGAVKVDPVPTLKAVVTDDALHRKAVLAVLRQQEEDRKQQLATQEEERRQQAARQEAVAQHMADQEAPTATTASTQPVPTAMQTAPATVVPPAAQPEVASRPQPTNQPSGPVHGQIKTTEENVMVLPELKPPISVPGSDQQ